MNMSDMLTAYWDRQPCNVRHSSLPVGGKEYFEEVRTRRYLIEPHIKEFAEFKMWSGKKVLEIGCGIGADAVTFAMHGADVTAVDASSESLLLARKHAETCDVRIEFIHGDIGSLSLSGFDLVYCFGVLHHTPDISAALINIRKSLTSSGELRLMVYATNSWKRALIDAGLDQPEAQPGCPLSRTYDRIEIAQLLNAHGFHIKRMYQRHLFKYDIPLYAKTRELKISSLFENMSDQMFAALESAFGWHLLIRAGLNV